MDTQEATTWECKKGEKGNYRGMPFEYQGCGVITPQYIDVIGKYRRRSCACEDAALHAYREAQERRYWLNQNEPYVFNWLGGRWHDMELRKLRFENFQADRQQAAHDAAKMFLDLMKGTLVLHGPYGIGKTHLLAALCNGLLDRRIGSRFTTAPKLFAAIQHRINAHDDYTDIVTQAIGASLLVIDDVDKARWSEFREEVYFEIIDERVKRNLPIALSTNRLDELSSFVGGACLSRLSIGQIAIEMVGNDYRLEL